MPCVVSAPGSWVSRENLIMALSYRPVDRDQRFVPPDMREWLPSSHLVWFVIESVDQWTLRGFMSGRCWVVWVGPGLIRRCC